MVKQIHVRAAAPIGDRKVAPVTLEISGFIPESIHELGEMGLDQIRLIFKADAEKVFDALRSLPGGTFDQLLILMLQHTASSFIVAHDFDKAHLRAAAPDLLAVCEEVLAEMRAYNPESEFDESCPMKRSFDWLKDAIAKARGESEVEHE